MNIKRIAILSAVVIAVICVNMLSLFDWDHDPVAKQGVMDLRGWTEGATKPLKLKGEWEFYPGQLLSRLPENQPASFPYIQAPGNWGPSLNADDARSAIGYGTYRLTVVMDAEQAGQIAFCVPLIRSAHRLIVDGQEIGAKGIVVTDPAQYFGQAVPYVAWKKIEKERFDIFVQVVNFDHAVSGGIIQPISMGPVAAIVGEHQRIAALDFAILVVYLLFTLYFGLLHFF